MEQPIKPNHLDADELYQLGIAYILDENGYKKPDADFASAIPYLEQASVLGHATAQASLATCYVLGLGTDVDYDKAYRWFSAAAEQGHAVSQYNLGMCYSRGEGTEKSAEQAFSWYRKSADQGDAAAQSMVALH